MNLNQNKPILLEELKNYHAFDDLEVGHLRKTLRWLIEDASPYSRDNIKGHITASAILTNIDFSQVLLIYHQKLQRWLQPGGHCELDLDLSPWDSALRELSEEANIKIPTVTSLQKQIFDIDVHEVGNKDNAHLHYDLRYLFQLKDLGNWKENGILKWHSVSSLSENPDESLSRFARKLHLR